MAEGEPNYTKRLKDTIRKNDRKISKLEEEAAGLKEELRRHHDNECQKQINKLKEEIQSLREENNTLQEKIRKLGEEIKDLKHSNTFLDKEVKRLEGLEEKLKIHERKLKEFEFSEDELVIRELCAKSQRNMLKIVLQDHFNEIQHKSTKYIPDYIKRQIKDEHEREEAKSRWEELRKELDWDDFWIKTLKPVKEGANETAHPSLSEEKINAAKVNLKSKKKLSEDMAEVVDNLKTAWIQTNSKLSHEASSAKVRVRGDRRNVSVAGQKRGTANGHADFLERTKRPRQTRQSVTTRWANEVSQYQDHETCVGSNH